MILFNIIFNRLYVIFLHQKNKKGEGALINHTYWEVLCFLSFRMSD